MPQVPPSQGTWQWCPSLLGPVWAYSSTLFPVVSPTSSLPGPATLGLGLCPSHPTPLSPSPWSTPEP